MKNLLLGKKTNYKKHYSQTILHKIKRSDKLNLKNFYEKISGIVMILCF